jgi:LPXTG-motif cell wall-anchored protein
MKALQSFAFRSMKSAVLAVVIGTALVVPFADQASAHTAPATGSSQCESGLATWKATVSILNDFSEEMTVTAISSSAPVMGLGAGSKAAAGTSAVAMVGGLTGVSVTITWTVTWPNGDSATNSVTVARPSVACIETIVTTTPTVPAPAPTTTTTVTTVPQPTTTVATPNVTVEVPSTPVVTVPDSVLGEGPVFPAEAPSAPAKAPALPVLPVTGSSSGSLVALAFAFMVAGLGLLVAASRRRRSVTSI